MIERLRSPRGMREGQRDFVTVSVQCLVTLVVAVFGIDNQEAIAAFTTLAIIVCHRAVPDMAGRQQG